MQRTLWSIVWILAVLLSIGVAFWTVTGGMGLAPMAYGERMVESMWLWLLTIVTLVAVYLVTWVAFARR